MDLSKPRYYVHFANGIIRHVNHAAAIELIRVTDNLWRELAIERLEALTMPYELTTLRVVNLGESNGTTATA